MIELIRRIERAFADVTYPGDDDLTDGTYGEEPAALVEAFRGKNHWRALDAAFATYDADKVSAIAAYLWWKLESLGGHDETFEQALENYWLTRDDGA